MKRTRGRKLICVLCGRSIGEHGYSNTGMLSRHKCPHGNHCSHKDDQSGIPNCIECRKPVSTDPLFVVKTWKSITVGGGPIVYLDVGKVTLRLDPLAGENRDAAIRVQIEVDKLVSAAYRKGLDRGVELIEQDLESTMGDAAEGLSNAAELIREEIRRMK